MSMIYVTVEIITSFIEILLLYQYYSDILYKFRKTHDTKLEVLLSILGTGLMYICNSVSVFSYYTMIVFVIFMSVSAIFLYKVNYFIVFSISCFYTLCLGCIDFLMFSVASILVGNSSSFANLVAHPSILRSCIIIIIKCIWILIYLGIRKYLYKIFVNKYYVYSMIFITGSGFLGFVYMVNQTFHHNTKSLTNTWILFLLCFIFLSLFMYFIFEIREEKLRLNFLEMRNKLLEENFREINDIYAKNAKLYHDLNNHLNVLFHLIDQQEISKAKDYISNISQPITRLSSIIWTGIDVVDVVINSKIAKAKDHGADIDLNVEFPKNSNIEPHDICTILANLLDNSIEAIEAVDDKKIFLLIRKINYFVMIKITNSCKDIVIKEGEMLATTKGNKQLHGWGLVSVKDAVEKYNGTMKFANKKNKFSVTIMLFMGNKK